MSRLLQPTTLAAALAVLLGISGLAPSSPQAAAHEPAQAPSTVPSTASIDPAARALLEQMAAAYKALTSYSGAMTFSGTGMPDPPHLRARITLQPPDRIAVTVDDEHGATHALADGARLYVDTPRLPGHYLTLPAPGGEQALQRALSHAGAAALSPTPYLFTGADLTQRLAPVLVALSVGKPGTMDGVAVQTVVATLNPKAGPRTLTFAIGKEDHLLRQASMTLQGEGKPATVTETHTDIKVNPKLAANAFAFAPPPSAQAVTDLQAWAASANVSAPSLAAAGLVVLPDKNKGTNGGAAAAPPEPRGRHDFGAVTLLDRPRIEHTFTLKNNANQPVTIERLQASCGCASALVQPDQKGTLGGADGLPKAAPTTLSPGQQALVRVIVDLAGLPPGPLHKPVSVFVQGSAAPAVVLEMHGTLLPNIIFAPAPVDFGRVDAGASKSRTLSVTLDARLAASGLPRLVSSNPAIHITPTLTEAGAGANPSGASPTNDTKNDIKRVQTYTLTVAPDAPIGPIMGSVQFVPTTTTVVSSRPAAAAAAADPAVAAVLRSASALVVGQVTGDVSAEPPMLALGVALAGQASARQIVLRAASPAALKDVKVSGNDAWLTARVGESTPGSPLTRTLEVRLGGGAPPGVLHSQVRVTLGNGQRLVVPVSGYVQEEAKP